MENISLQTVDRALMVLEMIAEKPMTQKEVEEATSLNRSTVRRLIYTLANRNYVEKQKNSSYYRLGLKVVELGSLKLNQVELKTEAAPYLRELSVTTNQVSHMGILSEGEVVYIEKLEPINSIRMFSAIGKRIPVHSTSLGKVLISKFSDESIIDILKEKGMKKFTKNTRINQAEFLADIKKVRECGFATDNEENEVNIWCIAAPILDYRNKLIAAISTSGGKKDYIENSNSNMISMIKKTAYKISKRMGYLG